MTSQTGGFFVVRKDVIFMTNKETGRAGLPEQEAGEIKKNTETPADKSKKENVIIRFDKDIPVLVEDWRYERPTKPKRRGGW